MGLPPWRWAALGASLAARSGGDVVELLISGEVRGAVYPVDGWGTSCDSEAYAADGGCGCYGGAARRVAAFEGRGSAVALDAGAHFFGSGLFFHTFEGEAGAEFFASSGYDAWVLHYYDFSAADAAKGPGDETGGQWLAEAIDAARALDGALPAPVATNLNVTGDVLDGRVAR